MTYFINWDTGTGKGGFQQFRNCTSKEHAIKKWSKAWGLTVKDCGTFSAEKV